MEAGNSSMYIPETMKYSCQSHGRKAPFVERYRLCGLTLVLPLRTVASQDVDCPCSSETP